MIENHSPNKVIPLPRRGPSCGGAEHDRRRKSQARVISITSGKGGVGKTNIVANLGYSLSRLGKKVMILDADLGLGNLDVLLGVAPKFNISHVIRGEKSMAEIIEAKVMEITTEFINEVHAHGFKDLSMEQLIQLKNADVL